MDETDIVNFGFELSDGTMLGFPGFALSEWCLAADGDSGDVLTMDFATNKKQIKIEAKGDLSNLWDILAMGRGFVVSEASEYQKNFLNVHKIEVLEILT